VVRRNERESIYSLQKEARRSRDQEKKLGPETIKNGYHDVHTKGKKAKISEEKAGIKKGKPHLQQNIWGVVR